jgi:hypothetical protein
MDTPGARISGLIAQEFGTGPLELKLAKTSLLSDAPTVKALRATPGEPIVWYP